MKNIKQEKKDIKAIPLKEYEKRFTSEQLDRVEMYQKYFKAIRELKDLRVKLHLTQQQLALKAGVPQETISRIESGMRKPNIETLISLVSAMGKRIVVDIV